ncbi:histone-fold-containing protein [Triangularia verruculosa]|uniref:Histone-fold-containing protein n=1 Tax=Triangularia verruculosa TaxID=2587418 RepID=A0AAN7AZM2_9PEZI|nr:histone-fold-containing protein [Triangularia verruculosa]
MPYNTTAIPPRKEVTGQTQLPLTRVKKIVAQDQDIQICSNNAAFVITLATEMFVQYLAEQAQEKTKLERKPRRNIQYKDIANAVAHQDNLEFLEDVVPKTTSYKDVKGKAAAARTRVKGEKSGAAAAAAAAADAERGGEGAMPNGKKHKATNGTHSSPANGIQRSRILSSDSGDPNAQLEAEAELARRGGSGEDVNMTG